MRTSLMTGGLLALAADGGTPAARALSGMSPPTRRILPVSAAERRVPVRIVVGISGASGSIYGIRLLEVLRDVAGLETHLVVSRAAKRTLVDETDYTVRDVEALATRVYDDRDIGAALASGSFHTAGMVVAPCSIKTLSALANSYADTLIARAGDVTLKEGRPLIVVVRETPPSCWPPASDAGPRGDGRRRPAAGPGLLSPP